MKKLLFLIVLMACSSTNNDWDSGAQRAQVDREQQRQEQIENTNMQDTTPGRSGVGQNQPF
jgi:hypothetical protein